MGKPKKGQLHQVMFPLVDATDFATIESAITSGLTCKFYGVNHGGSAAMTSGTVSKTASVVHSGIFRLCLKGTENNYDNMLLRVACTGCADQIVTWENADYDDSDIYSLVVAGAGLSASAISDVESALASRLSDILSAAQQINSRVLVAQSFLSDIRSNVSDLQSDFQSRVPKAVATNSQLSDLASDLKSYLAGVSGAVSDVYSRLYDHDSTFDQRVWAYSVRELTGIGASGISDIESALASRLSDILSAAQQTNSRALVIQSLVSDVDSALTSQFTAGHPLNASDMSDLRSAVLSLSAMLSDAHSAAAQANSRALVVQSLVSDVDSALTSQYTAGQNLTASAVSDIDSRLASRLSDILSAATQINSRALVIQSMVSDIDSALTSQFTAGHPLNASDMSDLRSAITGITAALSASDLSDLRSAITASTSDIKSAITASTSDIKSAIGNVSVSLTASDISDIASAVAAAGGGATQSQVQAIVTAAASDIKSQATVIYNMLSDVQSDFQSRVPKAVATASGLTAAASDLRSYLVGMSGMLSDVRSQVSDLQSDFQSRVPKAVATNSQLSDLASDLRSYLVGISGMVSDIDSALTSQFTYTSNALSDLQSDFQSRVPKAVATSSQVTAVQSDVKSQATVIYNMLSDLQSDFQSRVPKAVATNSQLSDLASDLKSYMAGVSGVVSDIYSLLSDVDSNFQSRVPKAVATNSQLSDLASDVKSAVTAVMTTAMTESYATDGAAPTPAQALFLIQQALTEFVINADVITVRKLDGSTPAATFTLDDETTPTSRTRAT